MTLLLSDADVRAVCDIGAMTVSLEEALRNEAKGPGPQLPERLNLAFGDQFMRLMPAILPEAGLLGLKFFHGSMRDGVRYVVALCCLKTGAMVALVDAAYLTAARTGATSGVATSWLSRDDSTSVGVIGSGLEAETNLRAVCSVRSITNASVYSRSPRRREAFADRLSSILGIRVSAVSTPQEAVASKDIVVVATNTGPEPVVALQGSWLEAGQHVVSIGSTTAALREIDVDTFLRAQTVVFDVSIGQLSHESGDVMALISAEPGWCDGVSLERVITGDALGRRHADDVTLFKSVGTAAQDLIGALHVVREARQLGIGTQVDEIAHAKQF